MVSYKPRNKIMTNILDRLINDNGAIKVNSHVANQFSKYREIRYLRKKDKIYIAKDHRKDTSIIFLDGVTLRKQNGRYFFDGL